MRSIPVQQQAISILATPIEAIIGGFFAGYPGVFVKALTSDPIMSFLLAHIITSASGATGFTALSVAFRLRSAFLEAKKTKPNLTVHEFWTPELKASTVDFAAKLETAGGLSFFFFTMLAEGFKDVGSVISKAGATAIGVLLFAWLNSALKLGLPLTKLAQVAMVFIGFACGSYLLEKIVADPSVNQTVLKYLMEPMLPGLMGAAGALLASTSIALLTCAGVFKSKPVQEGTTETSPLLKGLSATGQETPSSDDDAGGFKMKPGLNNSDASDLQ